MVFLLYVSARFQVTADFFFNCFFHGFFQGFRFQLRIIFFESRSIVKDLKGYAVVNEIPFLHFKLEFDSNRDFNS